MLFNQLTVVLHYINTAYESTIYIILLQELFNNMAFIAICFLFCRNSSKLLPNRKRYLKGLKIIGLISIVFFAVVFFVQIFTEIFDKGGISTSCKTPLYITFNLIQLPVSLMFVVAGFFIRKKIKSYVP